MTPGPAWQHREIHLSDDWSVRRVGGVYLPDIAHDSEAEAMATVNELLGPGWVEVPASRSPEVRYGDPR